MLYSTILIIERRNVEYVVNVKIVIMITQYSNEPNAERAKAKQKLYSNDRQKERRPPAERKKRRRKRGGKRRK